MILRLLHTEKISILEVSKVIVNTVLIVKQRVVSSLIEIVAKEFVETDQGTRFYKSSIIKWIATIKFKRTYSLESCPVKLIKYLQIQNCLYEIHWKKLVWHECQTRKDNFGMRSEDGKNYMIEL